MADGLYEACGALFTAYPLAVEPVTCDGTQSVMTLMLSDGGNAAFCTVHQVRDGEPFPFFVVTPLGSRGCGVVFTSGGETQERGRYRAADAQRMIRQGTPLPRDGALFGWCCDGDVTALIAIYTAPDSRSPDPAWAVMPLAGGDEGGWPPFTREDLFGPWFWEHCRAARIVDIGNRIAATSRTVFWVPVGIPDAGDGCIAVAQPVASGDVGFTLPAGRYVYYRALRDGIPIPALADLLAEPAAVDLGPRFQNLSDEE